MMGNGWELNDLKIPGLPCIIIQVNKFIMFINGLFIKWCYLYPPIIMS